MHPPEIPNGSVYTSCYCEENIYLLGKALLESSAAFIHSWEASVVFMSNETKTIVICQAANSQHDHLLPGHHPVIWDYHVVLILTSRASRESFVYDFDTRLKMGCPFEEYYQGTFPLGESLEKRFESLFRVIPLSQYLEYFASDRSHMIRVELEGGIEYHSSPPSYPCIKGPLATRMNNLFDFYVAMNPSDAIKDTGALDGRRLVDAPYGQILSPQIFHSVFYERV